MDAERWGIQMNENLPELNDCAVTVDLHSALRTLHSALGNGRSGRCCPSDFWV
jgi:hypothetical protein